MNEKSEALVAGSIAKPEPIVGGPDVIGNRSVITAHVKKHQQVIGQVYRIQKDRVGRGGFAIAGQALEFKIIGGGLGDRAGMRTACPFPEEVPSTADFHGAIAGLGGVRAWVSGGFHDIVIGLVASKILGTVAFVWPLVCVIQAPVLAVDVNVQIEDAGGRGDGQLGGPGPFIAKECVFGASKIGPRGILGRAQIKAIEGSRAGVAEQFVIHFPLPVCRPKKQSEGVLGVVGIAAEPASDAHAGVLLKAIGIGIQRVINDFHRNRPFGILASGLGADVNPGGGVGEIGKVGDKGNGRNGLQRRFHNGRSGGSGRNAPIYHHRIHAVVETLTIDARVGPACGCAAIGGLGDDIIKEKVSLGVNIGWLEPADKGCGAQGGRGIDEDRIRVDKAGGGRGGIAIFCIPDHRSRSVTGECNVEGSSEKSTMVREMGVAHKSQDAGAIRGARGGGGHESQAGGAMGLN